MTCVAASSPFKKSRFQICLPFFLAILKTFDSLRVRNDTEKITNSGTIFAKLSRLPEKNWHQALGFSLRSVQWFSKLWPNVCKLLFVENNRALNKRVIVY